MDHGAVGISADAQSSAQDVANLVQDVQTLMMLRQAYGPHFPFMFHHDHHECEADNRIQIKEA